MNRSDLQFLESNIKKQIKDTSGKIIWSKTLIRLINRHKKIAFEQSYVLECNRKISAEKKNLESLKITHSRLVSIQTKLKWLLRK